jgi:hypothetical protein
MRSDFHLVDVFKGGAAMSAGEADTVKVHVKKPYGSLIITVTDEGNIVLDAVDGDGSPLNTACIDPSDHCEVDDFAAD